MRQLLSLFEKPSAFARQLGCRNEGIDDADNALIMAMVELKVCP